MGSSNAKRVTPMADFNVLPEEIVMEILVWLPVRSLVQFRTMSKSWNALLTSHTFVKSHLVQSHSDIYSTTLILHYQNNLHDYEMKQLCLVGDNHGRGQFKYELSFNNLPLRTNRRDHLIDSCNGVVCIECGGSILLCNPSINEVVTLRPPHDSLGWETTRLVGFGHNPFSGYSNDFKVIRFYVEDCMEFEIYSTLRDNNNSWTKIDKCVIPLRLRNKLPYLGKQVIYMEFICWCPFEDSLLLFDVVKEEFSEMELPHCLNSGGNERKKQIALLDGCLSLITFVEFEDVLDQTLLIDKSVHVWVMKEKAVWTKLYTTDLLTGCEPLGFVMGGCVVCRFDDDRLILYNSRTVMLEPDWVPYYRLGRYVCCCAYKESLVSVLLINKS